MSEDCVFCGIVAGDIPSYTVAETDTTIAFLDANPLARGHTVVIPKDHHERIRELPDGQAGDVFETVQAVVTAAEDAVDADGTSVGINDGEVAGQVVPHVHCHVVPRWEDDGGQTFHAVGAGLQEFSEEELEAIAADIRAAGSA